MSKIHEGSTPTQWRNIGSKENPADYGSAGSNDSKTWLSGPSFLLDGEFSKFSSWTKLCKVSAWVLCIVDKSRCVTSTSIGNLSVSETDTSKTTSLHRCKNLHLHLAA